MAVDWNIKIPQLVVPDYSQGLAALGSGIDAIGEARRRALARKDYERQNEIADENRRQRQEELLYQRSRDAKADADKEKEGIAHDVGRITDLADAGKLPGAQALAAARGIPFSDQQFAPLPDQGPQLQMPGAVDENAPPASMKFPGLNLKMPELAYAPGDEPPSPNGKPQPNLQIPGLNMRMPSSPPPDMGAGAVQTGASTEPADFGGFARTFLGASRPPDMRGLADQPDELTTRGGAPTIGVNGQAIRLDPGAGERRADAATERQLRKSMELMTERERAAQQAQERSFAARQAMADDAQAARQEDIKLRAKLKGAGAGGSGAGSVGEPNLKERAFVDRSLNSWARNVDFKKLNQGGQTLRSATANLESDDPHAAVQHKDAAIAMARVFRGNTPTEGEMKYVYGGLAHTFENALPALIEKWSTGDISRGELEAIRASVKTSQSEYKGNVKMALDSARESLGTDRSEYARRKVSGLFRVTGLSEQEINAALGAPTGGGDGGKKYSKAQISAAIAAGRAKGAAPAELAKLEAMLKGAE